MPNLTAWPTADQLNTALASHGITLPPGASATGYVNQAVMAWERMAGYGFLGDGASASILYDAPYAKFMHLGRWWLSISGVATGVSEADTTGNALDIGTTVFLKKSRSGHIYGLDFISEFVGSQESIKVTGVPGWASSDADDAAYLPDDAFQAVMDYACGLAMDQARQMNGVVSEVKSADATVKFAENSEPMRFAEAALARLKGAARNYRLVQF